MDITDDKELVVFKKKMLTISLTSFGALDGRRGAF